MNSTICGAIYLITYDTTSLFHVVISINRFIAVFKPFSYNTVFNPRTTRVIIFSVITLSLLIVNCWLFIIDCRFSFDEDHWTFLVTDSDHCDVFVWTTILGKNIILSIVNVILHVITMIKVITLKQFVSVEIVWLRI